MDTEKAVEGGAMALFGEKYGDSVRVVSVPGFSKELCGGTHVARTGEIGLFKFTAEHSVSAGVRRVEAVCHMPAYHHLAERAKWLDDTAGLLNTAPEEVHSAVLKMIDLAKNREKELSRLRLKAASSGDVADETVEVEGLKLVRRLVEGLSGSEVKNLADTLRDKAGSGIVVIGNRLEGKATITVAVTPDQMERVAARDLVRPLGKVIAGGGGGKPDIAEAGGKAPEKLQEALDRAPAILKDMLNK